MKWRNIAKGLFQYFLQGLIILAPIAITVYAVAALFNFVDNILPDILENIFPTYWKTFFPTCGGWMKTGTRQNFPVSALAW